MIPNILTSKSTTKSGKQVTNLAWWVTLLLSLALSVGTWNPTEHDFVHYISNVDDIFSGFRPFVILVIIALWMLAIKSIFQSLGLFGFVMTLVTLGAFVWGLQQYELIDVTNFDDAGWAATVAVGLIIWFGLNASIIWKRLTGVYTTEHPDED
ncbi:MAG: Unknown protein [uncultured Sulfurovum sp.]|uniref:Uncharacterized protein n=1 Tax=uncultured Sulfurovum sp. TaxID=269237 RepID=A0A6S6S924_9BACT|nr:MAG: Unknown protein [uncultured Sulfurovum sp.]